MSAKHTPGPWAINACTTKARAAIAKATGEKMP